MRLLGEWSWLLAASALLGCRLGCDPGETGPGAYEAPARVPRARLSPGADPH